VVVERRKDGATAAHVLQPPRVAPRAPPAPCLGVPPRNAGTAVRARCAPCLTLSPPPSLSSALGTVKEAAALRRAPCPARSKRRDDILDTLARRLAARHAEPQQRRLDSSATFRHALQSQPRFFSLRTTAAPSWLRRHILEASDTSDLPGRWRAPATSSRALRRRARGGAVPPTSAAAMPRPPPVARRPRRPCRPRSPRDPLRRVCLLPARRRRRARSPWPTWRRRLAT
jgi:hypothetical protein